MTTERSYFQGVQAKLNFPRKEDKHAVLDLMRRFSSARRYAYNRLVEGVPREKLWSVEGPLGTLFGLGSYYIQGALLKAEMALRSAKERGIDPEKVVFGGRKLFLDLRKKHNLKVRKKKKREWKEKRQGLLYCRGKKRAGGNPNLRLEVKGGVLQLRINLGHGTYAPALVQTTHPNLGQLLQRVYARESYNVELTLKEGEVYANFTWEEKAPPLTSTRENGVLALDVNAEPYHLALALVGPDGSLRYHFTLPLDQVDRAPNRGAKETLLWMVAHEVTDFAVANGVAIATERLKHLRKSRRGDGSGRNFRRLQHRFAYASLLRKIHTLALKKGVEILQVNPQDTSTIGMLKYASQLSLSKDVAAAYVIGRRALGFEEKVPKSYQALLADPRFREDAEAFYRERVEELKEGMEKEKNPYLKCRLSREAAKAEKALVLLSPRSSPGSRKEVTGGRNSYGVNPWRVLRVGLFLPFLGGEVPRDLSRLKPVLVQGPPLYRDRGRGKEGGPRSLLPGRADGAREGAVRDLA
ncbi:IS200/IS605 family accessory protein TnpB-related protein [Thermus filiformis]|uniref:IS200/IS605 family accessory protein TnpB-related protein n=1 Tax=Thermus filiformis TaxID=276 RepID=UPI000531ABB6|nr:IS200/IS605 family accessory protein TnpB-related protein [Thermus filiformis]